MGFCVIILRVVMNNGGGRGLVNTATGLCFDRPAQQPQRWHSVHYVYLSVDLCCGGADASL